MIEAMKAVLAQLMFEDESLAELISIAVSLKPRVAHGSLKQLQCSHTAQPICTDIPWFASGTSCDISWYVMHFYVLFTNLRSGQLFRWSSWRTFCRHRQIRDILRWACSVPGKNRTRNGFLRLDDIFGDKDPLSTSSISNDWIESEHGSCYRGSYVIIGSLEKWNDSVSMFIDTIDAVSRLHPSRLGDFLVITLSLHIAGCFTLLRIQNWLQMRSLWATTQKNERENSRRRNLRGNTWWRVKTLERFQLQTVYCDESSNHQQPFFSPGDCVRMYGSWGPKEPTGVGIRQEERFQICTIARQ